MRGLITLRFITRLIKGGKVKEIQLIGAILLALGIVMCLFSEKISKIFSKLGTNIFKHSPYEKANKELVELYKDASSMKKSIKLLGIINIIQGVLFLAIFYIIW